ncbi:MAG TPA: glycine--tRNA ligase [Candidatus Nanoarchaeia archaeon]|nr:glycine--tRNA ligase [Candidatus Nanoarchaeia archaeon]
MAMQKAETNSKYEAIMNLAQRRSLFFPSSPLYYPHATPAGLWDYGPYGAAIRRKVIDLWRKDLVQKENFLEIYGSQIMPAAVFQASGHLTSLVDPITLCQKCHAIYRADKLITEVTKKHVPEAMEEKEFDELIKKNKIVCQKCKSYLTPVKKFNMMVSSPLGIGKQQECYLRPETCQTIFVDFDQLMKTMRIKLPQGISQVGRSFRNEISPRQGILRAVEFSQMETEVFFNPEKINELENFEEVENYKVRVLLQKEKEIKEISAKELVSKKIVSGKLVAYYLARVQQLYEKYGLPTKALRFREVAANDRAFYSKETWDFEVETSLGWLELIANNYRTDYDLKGHGQASKKDLSVLDENNKRFIPHVWEISIGVDRTFYAILEHAYREEGEGEKKRVFLSLKPQLAPIDFCIFPLVSKEGLPEKAREIYQELRQGYSVFYDEAGSIGKRYARADEVGVPFCLTIDFGSLNDHAVTIRERDSVKQKRVKIKDLKNTIYRLLIGEKF